MTLWLGGSGNRASQSSHITHTHTVQDGITDRVGVADFSHLSEIPLGHSMREHFMLGSEYTFLNHGAFGVSLKPPFQVQGGRMGRGG